MDTNIVLYEAGNPTAPTAANGSDVTINDGSNSYVRKPLQDHGLI
jgi:hypothetical protein